MSERTELDQHELSAANETPTVEARVYQHGKLLARELVESEEEASAATARWSELDAVQCEVDDLTVRHEAGEILEPEPALLNTDEDERL